MDSEENSPWQYKPDNGNPGAPADASSTDSADSAAPKRPAATSVSWQASEFIEHRHGAGWYGMLVLVTLLLSAGAYFLTKDYIATGTMIIVGVIVGVFAGHKPKQVQYEISDNGLSVEGKTYSYSLFKSFAVIQDGALSSVNLFPLKRFMPPVSAYFAPQDEKKIVEALGQYLPLEERGIDNIDRLTRRLRL